LTEPGQPAPDFTLRDQDGTKVALSELKGQTVVLVFYPLDWSPVCTDQLNLYQEAIGEFKDQGATLYGVSVDSAFSHKAFQDHLGLEIPLLADFEPKGDVARKYGMYIEDRGHNERGFVVIDPEGNIKHSHKSPSPLEIPAASLILDALAP
jgi:peroxiredoxin (alkyl hydroperoxide reductase subunit C)